MREIKVRAARENRKLKDAIAELLWRGLLRRETERPTKSHRVSLPLVDCAREAQPTDEMTPQRVARILEQQEAEAHGVPVR